MQIANEHNRQIKPKILSVGTAVPKQKFTQQQIASLLNIKNEKALRFFNNPHIQTRHLCEFDQKAETSNATLLLKFKKNSLILSTDAIMLALTKADIKLSDIDFICCVTSTGFLVPGLSSLLIEHLNLNYTCQKLDIVGMGCSAGLNGLSAVSSWCQSHPSKKALLVCCEISSAIYCLEDTENNALVNSLFADGVAAAIVSLDEKNTQTQPQLLKFSTYTAKNSLNALRFDWNEQQNRNQFFVSKETPELLGAHIQNSINLLLQDGPPQKEIKHWIFHSGGTAILDKIEKNLNLSSKDLRHTRSVLRDYGNISSGSFLFSYQQLLNENLVTANQFGIMATMGPGLTIETALLKW